MISNRTISILLIAVLGVYLGGLAITLQELGYAGFPTGFVTSNQSGNVTVRISATNSITWVSATIDWGSGYVSGACNNCTMYVNTSHARFGNSGAIDSFDRTCCVGFNWSNESLLLKNNGNQRVSLRMNVTNNRTSWFGTAAIPSGFDFKVEPVSNRTHFRNDTPQDTVNSCEIENWGNGSHNAVATGETWYSLDNLTSSAGWDICGSGSTYLNFSPVFNGNEANFDFRVMIPQNYTTAGTLSSVIFVQATS